MTKLYLSIEKTEFIFSSEIKCPKSGIFTNNYWVGWVGQSNFVGYHSSFFGRCRKIFFGQIWFSPLEKNGPHAYMNATELGTNRKRVCDFLLVRHSDLGTVTVLHRFSQLSEILQVFCAHDPYPYSTIFWGCSHWNSSFMLGSIWARTLSYSAMKLFLKYSNLCESHAWTSQTVRQTDASRGENRTTVRSRDGGFNISSAFVLKLRRSRK